MIPNPKTGTRLEAKPTDVNGKKSNSLELRVRSESYRGWYPWVFLAGGQECCSGVAENFLRWAVAPA